MQRERMRRTLEAGHVSGHTEGSGNPGIPGVSGPGWVSHSQVTHCSKSSMQRLPAVPGAGVASAALWAVLRGAPGPLNFEMTSKLLISSLPRCPAGPLWSRSQM